MKDEEGVVTLIRLTKEGKLKWKRIDRRVFETVYGNGILTRTHWLTTSRSTVELILRSSGPVEPAIYAFSVAAVLLEELLLEILEKTPDLQEFWHSLHQAKESQ